MTGITFIVQPFVQMIGGFLFPGKPMANMFFVLYSYSELLILTCAYNSTPDIRQNRFSEPGGTAAQEPEDRSVYVHYSSPRCLTS